MLTGSSKTRLLDAVDFRRLHRQFPDRYPFLLQSTAGSAALGRYDILFAFPGAAIVADDQAEGTPFLQRLDAAFSAERLPAGAGDLPFTGGWFLYLAYELAADIEPGLQLQPDAFLPAAFAVRCPAALIRDRQTDCVYWVHEDAADIDTEQLYADIRSAEEQADETAVLARPEIQEADARAFTDAVSRVRDYIAAGDVYQANLSREWSVRVDPAYGPDELYAALCQSNPAPFAGSVKWQDVAILSSSPERLLRVRDGIASTRPIAGTRPRSEQQAMDEQLLGELISHPKERAEHVMLIDLERNDLGRICVAGSVEVDEMMVLESYAHVHHIVSNVRGRLRDSVSPGQCIAAVFPGGTITGCPKVRCMEIISELEQGSRGAYTGSFGYLNRDGSMDLNILIRTMVMQNDQVSFRAGSGIVADSQPDAELRETRAKAKGMLRAVLQ